ncbi:hypothetical protein [Sporomusa acidovorans]|uniref:Uncharacterized protein n=1 Tax=Sporomusa acidovorans (strain ATCC 49682 / DSM 3132 / Mol) TaxID=1123286 RepID=A0ABZ3J722_SPOA4|nr:hypothetical protein [Sporomusa acidovorans]OZC23846.1 hypothetical protein SPACI_04710 [Sporomusa acidovorans DSM 3132]SDF81534.1 hypothetical protein SAMN04488499_108812 [Sporomusa acidovorans]
MIKIAHVREVTGLQLPQEVVTVVKEAVTVLDAEYGEDRAVDSGYGGYVLVMESEKDVQSLPNEIRAALPEYVDVLPASAGEFVSVLVLLGSDFGVVVIMPRPFLSLTSWIVPMEESKGVVSHGEN